MAIGNPLRRAHPKRIAARHESRSSLVEQEDGGLRLRISGAAQVRRGHRRLANAGRADEERRRSPGEPSAKQRIQLVHTARDRDQGTPFGVGGRHELRIDNETAARDREVVKAFGRRLAAQFDDANPPPRAACTRTAGVRATARRAPSFAVADLNYGPSDRRAAAPCCGDARKTPSVRESAGDSGADLSLAGAALKANRKQRARVESRRRVRERPSSDSRVQFLRGSTAWYLFGRGVANRAQLVRVDAIERPAVR